MDELRGVRIQGQGRNLCEKGIAFDIAMGTKARRDSVKIAVVVAGMADEFEGSFGGHALQNLVKGFPVEVAGRGDADGAVGREDAVAADLRLLLEPRLQAAKQLHLKAAKTFPMA